MSYCTPENGLIIVNSNETWPMDCSRGSSKGTTQTPPFVRDVYTLWNKLGGATPLAITLLPKVG